MLAETEAPRASVCPVCWTENAPDARFCKACGSALRAPDTCPACGTTLPTDASFCPGCGARVVGARPPAISPELEPIQPPPASEPNDLRAAQQEIEEAAKAAPKPSQVSVILTNLALFGVLTVAVLLVIKEMNEGKPKEMSPFEGPPPSGMVPVAPEAPSAGARFQGTIEVAEAVDEVPKGTLFIIARLQGAPDRGPPIAVKRVTNPSFPLTFELTANDVMQPGMPFDGPFDVRARLDTDGNAMTKSPGDLFTSTPAAAKPGDAGIRVLLDESIE